MGQGSDANLFRALWNEWLKYMLRIGLTGGIGSGKSSAAEIFSELGITVIDADEIAHRLTGPGQPVLRAITRHFGENILNNDGSLNRQALRELVFSDNGKRRELEDIMHPVILAEMKKQTAALEDPYCILMIPLLIETAQQATVDRILVVDCPEDRQIQRVLQRDDMTEKQARSILDTQATREKRLEMADDVLYNNTDNKETLKEQVCQLHRKYLEICSPGC
mgnify:CR=1 FL=1